MTDEELFDQFVSQHGLGRRLDLNQLPPHATSAFGKLASKARRYIKSAHDKLPTLPPIHFDFIENTTVNAVAFFTHGRYFIGVNGGAVLAMQMLFCRILADNQILPGVGNVTNEVQSLPLLAALVPDQRGILDAQSALDAGEVVTLPRDSMRKLYARFLCDTALSFLIGHEITHIANGHIDWCNRQSIPFVAELGYAPVGTTARLDRQAIEWDADCCAVCHGIGTIRIKIDNPELALPPWDEFYRTPADAAFVWCFAFCGLCRLFGDTPFAGTDLTIADYPPWRFRQAISLTTAWTYIHDCWNADLADPAAKSMANAMGEVEKAFQVITGKPRAVQGLKDATGPESEVHLGKLEEHWKQRMRAELLPYAYGTLPA